MARIRTLRPEFPQSESMGRVSRDARLLFIQLWTIVDDSGRARGNSRMLASLLFPYDDDAPAMIDGWIKELEAEGCVRRYEVEGQSYIDIPNWLKHQRIDKPTPSRLPEFQVVVANPRESSRGLPVGSGSGSGREGKGEEGKGNRTAGPAAPAGEKKTVEGPVTGAAWAAYAASYSDRYGTEPSRNATVNGQLAAFVKRIGAEEAPDVAAFYVKHDDAFYVRKGHPVGLLLSDAEKLRTEWFTGKKITGAQARDAERRSTTAAAVAAIAAEESRGNTH